MADKIIKDYHSDFCELEVKPGMVSDHYQSSKP